MGFFSDNKLSPAELAEDHRSSANTSRKAAAAARAVGMNKTADKERRNAATDRVVARYAETGRCQFGHRNCAADDH